jgi:hypothetical protein
MAHLRGHVNDGTGLILLDQSLCYGLSCEEGSQEVKVEDGIKILNRHILEGCGPISSGIIDQDVEGGAAPQGVSHQLRIRDVNAQSICLPTRLANRCRAILNFPRAPCD